MYYAGTLAICKSEGVLKATGREGRERGRPYFDTARNNGKERRKVTLKAFHVSIVRATVKHFFYAGGIVHAPDYL